MTYYPGSTVRVSGRFIDKGSGADIDPGGIVLLLKSPTGVETTHSPTRDALGKYHFDVTVDEPGRWQFRWETGGTPKAADEGFFYVEESAFS